MTTTRLPAPGYFLWIGMLFLAWNIVGDFMYVVQVSADLTKMAKTDPYTAKSFAEMPKWAWSCYAIGVWGGTLASLLMLMRRGLAVPVYALSLLAILIQFGHAFLGTDLIAVKGVVTAMALPVFIIVLAIVELLFARAMKARRIII